MPHPDPATGGHYTVAQDRLPGYPTLNWLVTCFAADGRVLLREWAEDEVKRDKYCARWEARGATRWRG